MIAYRTARTSLKCILLLVAVLAASTTSLLPALAADHCATGAGPAFCARVLNIRHPKKRLYFNIYIPSWTKRVAPGVGVSHWNVQDGSRPQLAVRGYGFTNRSKRTYILARPGGNYTLQVQQCLKLTLALGGSSCGPWHTFTLADPGSRRVEGKGGTIM